jgi:hypothetical protein
MLLMFCWLAVCVAVKAGGRAVNGKGGARRQPTITHRVFMDLSVDDVKVGRLVYGLFGKVCPKMTENFRALCTGELGVSNITGKVSV